MTTLASRVVFPNYIVQMSGVAATSQSANARAVKVTMFNGLVCTVPKKFFEGRKTNDAFEAREAVNEWAKSQ